MFFILITSNNILRFVVEAGSRFMPFMKERLSQAGLTMADRVCDRVATMLHSFSIQTATTSKWSFENHRMDGRPRQFILDHE